MRLTTVPAVNHDQLNLALPSLLKCCWNGSKCLQLSKMKSTKLYPTPWQTFWVLKTYYILLHPYDMLCPATMSILLQQQQQHASMQQLATPAPVSRIQCTGSQRLIHDGYVSCSSQHQVIAIQACLFHFRDN